MPSEQQIADAFRKANGSEGKVEVLISVFHCFGGLNPNMIRNIAHVRYEGFYYETMDGKDFHVVWEPRDEFDWQWY